MPAVERRRVAAALLAAVALLSSCSSGGSSEAEPPRPAEVRRVPTDDLALPPGASYVALGDSFTAAPFVPVTDLAGGCLRSSGNYPSLLAEDLAAELVDVSCSAATTADVRGRQQVAGGRGTLPPQLRAVRRGTDLVTVGLGGNDEGLFTSLIGCAAAGSCTPPDPGLFARTGRRLADVLRAVRRSAPSATVVLVGYPRLVAAGRSCRDLPVPAAQRPALVAAERALNQAMAAAARRSGAAYLDLHPLSRGREICSADPWVNGARTDQQRALAYHPFAQEQQAVAEALAELLTSGEESP